MKRVILFLLLISLSFFSKAGTPYGAEITYYKVSGFTFHFKITLYIFNTVLWDSASLHFGDSTLEYLPKTNEVSFDSLLITKVDFETDHTYPGEGTYVISFTANRAPLILNINGGNSVTEPMYIEDTLFIRDPVLLPFDYSISFSHLQTEVSFDGATITHNAELIAADADSITYQLVKPRKGNTYPVANYVFPNEIPGTPPDQIFVINNEGLIIWTSPYFNDLYCVAVLATVWKYGVRMGTVIRDMNIKTDGLTGIGEVNHTYFNIFPNPTSTTITLSLPSNQNAMLSIFNLLGEKVKEEKVTGKQVTMDVSSLPQGLYLVRMENGVVGKFVKE